MRTSNLLFSLFLAAAVAGPPCQSTQDPPQRPGCTDDCLKEGDIKGICLNNLREICAVDATDEYFDNYGDCFLNDCHDDDDLYSFLNTFKIECDAVKKPLTKIDGRLGDFLTRPDDGSNETSTSISISTSTWSPEESKSDRVTKSSDATTASEAPKESTSTTSEISSTTQTYTSTSQPQPGPAPTNAPPPASTDIPQTSTMSTTTQTSTNATPTTTPAPLPNPKPKDNPTLSKAQVAGVTAGGIAGLAVAIGAIIFLIQRRRKRPASFSQPSLPEPPEAVTGATYTTDRFGNVHPSEWSDAPHYGGGVQQAAGIGESQGGFAQRAFMTRNADLGTNF